MVNFQKFDSNHSNEGLMQLFLELQIEVNFFIRISINARMQNILAQMALFDCVIKEKEIYK